MTKRWSSTKSDLPKTKREASKEAKQFWVGDYFADYDEVDLPSEPLEVTELANKSIRVK